MSTLFESEGVSMRLVDLLERLYELPVAREAVEVWSEWRGGPNANAGRGMRRRDPLRGMGRLHARRCEGTDK